MAERSIATVPNSNPYSLGCANGILDLQGPYPEDPRITFSEGKHDDSVTYKMGHCSDMEAIPYIPYEEICDDPINVEINDFFEKLFTDVEERNYVWRLLASCLEGTNKAQELYTWIGKGGNGKSALTELMRITFGDYACALPATVLTNSRGDNDIITIRNKRFIYTCEPDESEPLNIGFIKQLVGEDYMMIHNRASELVQFKITGKLMIMCNNPIPINSKDEGTWRRIKVVPFNSKFVKSGRPEYDPDRHIYYQDEQLNDKLRQWRVHFFSKLVHVYITEYRKLIPVPTVTYREQGLAAPTIITDAVTEYRNHFEA